MRNAAPAPGGLFYIFPINDTPSDRKEIQFHGRKIRVLHVPAQ
jgi:hypothetical protein